MTTTNTAVPMTAEQKTLAREAINAMNPAPAWLMPAGGAIPALGLVIDRTETVDGVELQRETDPTDVEAIREALAPIFGRIGLLTVKDTLSPNQQDALDTVGQRF